mmetsp:Transcript_25471/g.53020  ORF Transcript_25471/g.53020 Transcript_25471/m.53020 type:complete len:275 (-) Transcript_25471:91-915(-)
MNRSRYESTSCYSSTDLHVVTQHFDHRFEGKPFGDIISSTQHLTELGSGQFLGVQSLFLGVIGRGVSLFFRVDQVKRWHGGDTQLFRHFLGKVLGVVGTIEIFARDTGFGSGHVTSNNEMCASKVLSDNHVLNGLTGSGHVHGIRQVLPLDTRVGGFFLEHFVSLVTNFTRDIISLSRTASGVDQDNTTFSNQRIIEGAGKEFVMGAMDGVTALKGHNIGIGGEFGSDFLRSFARKVTDGQIQTSHLTTHVVLSTFRGHHEGTRMFNGGSSVTL